MESKFVSAEKALKTPSIEPNEAIHSDIRKARKKLHKICSILPTELASKYLLHCVAPTGTGKTISCGLLGARIAVADEEIKHLIFATPYILLTEQAEKVLKTQLMETSIQVAKTHSKMAYKSEAERKKARKLGFDVTICTTEKLRLSLLGYKNHQGAQQNLEKSVIIIDDASQFLTPKIASTILVLLNQLRLRGARIILASATLPHYDTIKGYLPAVVKIHRFGQEIQNMAGIKNRCRLEMHTRPVGLDQLAKIVKKEKRPSMIICETVRKSVYVFDELKKAIPKARCFLINAKQSKYRKKEDIAIIEKALLSRGSSKIIVVSTSSTNSGWNVSFASGIHDTYNTIMGHEHGGRINRGKEFGDTCTLHCMQIQIPGVPRNRNVDTSRRIALTLMETNQFDNPMAPTIAAEMELREQNGEGLKESRKCILAAQTGNMLYLKKHLQTIDYRGETARSVLPPVSHIPSLYKDLKNLFTGLGIRAQVFKDGKIHIKEKISHKQIQDLLEKSEEIYGEFAIEINAKKLQDFQGLGDVLRRIVYYLPNGEEIETEYYFLSPKAFNPETGMLVE